MATTSGPALSRRRVLIGGLGLVVTVGVTSLLSRKHEPNTPPSTPNK